MKPMRRSERAVTNLEEIQSIVAECKVCRLGMFDGKEVYVVPMNFGCQWQGEELTFYFHCAGAGRKLDILRERPSVCVELDCRYGLIQGKEACGYSYHFASLIGTGKAQVVTEPEEKILGLQALMRQQTGQEFAITEQMAASVTVIRVTLAEYSCKQH